MRGWTTIAVAVLCAACATTGKDAGDIPTDPQGPSPETLPATAPESEEPLENTLRWTTASEVDNFGFDIYRSTSEDGPFERMTAEPLPGAGTVDEPQEYVWVDSDIDPERDYWYYIESISIDNVRERFSPIIRAPAKLPSGGGGAEGGAGGGD
jgi:hypothetical protein